jgi:hypothetical protein
MARLNDGHFMIHDAKGTRGNSRTIEREMASKMHGAHALYEAMEPHGQKSSSEEFRCRIQTLPWVETRGENEVDLRGSCPRRWNCSCGVVFPLEFEKCSSALPSTRS